MLTGYVQQEAGEKRWSVKILPFFSPKTLQPAATPSAEAAVGRQVNVEVERLPVVIREGGAARNSFYELESPVRNFVVDGCL